MKKAFAGAKSVSSDVSFISGKFVTINSNFEIILQRKSL